MNAALLTPILARDSHASSSAAWCVRSLQAWPSAPKAAGSVAAAITAGEPESTLLNEANEEDALPCGSPWFADPAPLAPETFVRGTIRAWGLAAAARAAPAAVTAAVRTCFD